MPTTTHHSLPSNASSEPLLTPRWQPLRPHAKQLQLCTEPKRFKLVPAGRRSGKSERAKRRVVRAAFATPGQNFLCGAPTHAQAKGIFWKDLLALTPKWALAAKPNRTELTIPLINGSSITVAGMDQPQRVEGRPWHGVVLDEYGNMKPEAWPENIRPTLSDTKGWAWLIGVPEGRNHYYGLTIKHADDPDWGIYSWPSSDILDATEIAAAKRDLDELTFKQEYEASFINFEGQAYYPFQNNIHVGKIRQLYNPRDDLSFCFDFNVSPGVAAVIQELNLPVKSATVLLMQEQAAIDSRNATVSTLPFTHARVLNAPTQAATGTGVIGEVHIDRNSNTPAVCRRLIQDWGKHEGRIFVYGDATGGSRGSAKVEGSDWDLVKRELKRHFGDRVNMRVPAANPAERARVNAVNTRLRAGDGSVRMMVDGGAAPHVVMDFEGVRLLKGGSGEIDKKHDHALTHISDALGYYVVHQFPTTKAVRSTSEVVHV